MFLSALADREERFKISIGSLYSGTGEKFPVLWFDFPDNAGFLAIDCFIPQLYNLFFVLSRTILRFLKFFMIFLRILPIFGALGRHHRRP
jgi:hypothetical protein